MTIPSLPEGLEYNSGSNHAIIKVFRRTDWRILAEQKEALVQQVESLGTLIVQLKRAQLDQSAAETEGSRNELQGLLHFIDAIQDAAADDGYAAFPEENQNA